MRVQDDIDRLATIIANYVGVYQVGEGALSELEQLCERLGVSKYFENFWRDRFEKAHKQNPE